MFPTASRIDLGIEMAVAVVEILLAKYLEIQLIDRETLVVFGILMKIINLK